MYFIGSAHVEPTTGRAFEDSWQFDGGALTDRFEEEAIVGYAQTYFTITGVGGLVTCDVTETSGLGRRGGDEDRGASRMLRGPV